MINRNKLSHILFILVSFLYTSKVKAQIVNYQGKWISTTTTSEFNLTLTQSNGSLTGSHCSIMLSGDKIDCTQTPDEVSVTGKVLTDTMVTLTFKSSFCNKSGKATLRKINATTVEWTIIEKPQGEFFIPLKASLAKDLNLRD